MSQPEASLMDEVRGALPWVILGVLALGGAIAYFVITGAADPNTLPADYGSSI